MCLHQFSPVVGLLNLKHLLDKATKHQSYLPVSKEKWNTQPQWGKEIQHRWILPAIHPLSFWHPLSSVQHLLGSYCVWLTSPDRPTGSLKAGQPSSLGCLLCCWRWAEQFGLLAYWLTDVMGAGRGRLIPAEETLRAQGRQVQAWREWCQEWNGGGRKLSSSKGVCPHPPSLT